LLRLHMSELKMSSIPDYWSMDSFIYSHFTCHDRILLQPSCHYHVLLQPSCHDHSLLQPSCYDHSLLQPSCHDHNLQLYYLHFTLHITRQLCQRQISNFDPLHEIWGLYESLSHSNSIQVIIQAERYRLH
jgi:hypothetical protein